jgi:hypothetical protein
VASATCGTLFPTGWCGLAGDVGRTDTASTNRFGWTIGGGVEATVWSSWLVRAEYRHTDYGTFNYTLLQAASNLDAFSASLRYRTNTALVGFPYRFGGLTSTPVTDRSGEKYHWARILILAALAVQSAASGIVSGTAWALIGVSMLQKAILCWSRLLTPNKMLLLEFTRSAIDVTHPTGQRQAMKVSWSNEGARRAFSASSA